MTPVRPDFIDYYYLTPDADEPKCCHTCMFYIEAGHCTKYKTKPPADFAETLGACELWDSEIPF